MRRRDAETEPLLRRARWLALGVLVAGGVGWGLLAAASIPGNGLERAAEDPDFRTCVAGAGAGAGLDGVGDLDAEQEADRWASPGLLACAESTLDDDGLAAATERLFATPRDGVRGALLGSGPGEDVVQGPALRQLGRDVAQISGDDAAVEAVVRVLGTRPDGQSPVTGPAESAAFGIVEATGEVPGYEEFLERNEGSDVEPEDLFSYYLDDDLLEAPQSFQQRWADVLDPIAGAARATWQR